MVSPYVKLISERRRNASSKFKENYYKLMSSSAYGKTMESKRNRRQVKIIRNYKDMMNEVNKTTFESFVIINDQLATASSRTQKFVWDKPTLVGAVILDLSKKFMFDFHYMKMKSNLNLELLYGDTDSLIYKVQSDDVHQDFFRNKHLKRYFDFSNFPETHPLYSGEDKRVVLKFKDEMRGAIVKEFVGLKPKLYSFLTEGK